METKKNSFLLYKDSLSFIKNLSIEQRGQLFTNILLYVNDEPLIDVDPIVDGVQMVVLHNINREKLLYETKCKKMQDNINSRYKRTQKNTKEYKSYKSLHTDTDTETDTEKKEREESFSLLVEKYPKTVNTHDNTLAYEIYLKTDMAQRQKFDKALDEYIAEVGRLNTAKRFIYNLSTFLSETWKTYYKEPIEDPLLKKIKGRL